MFDVCSGRKLLGTLAVTLLAAGCGGGGGTSAPPPAFDGDPSQVLTIRIRNDQMDMARVTLWIESTRRRLGDVRGLMSETFHVPLERPSLIRMEFDLTLGAECLTRDITLSPGEVIDVRIPVDLRMMQAVCRGGR